MVVDPRHERAHRGELGLQPCAPPLGLKDLIGIGAAAHRQLTGEPDPLLAQSSATRKRSGRRLWASDRNGRFRTHGRDSVATVRGTVWSTADRCDGTLTRVKEGKVLVRDLRRKRSVLLTAGRSYLARHRR